MDDFPKFRGENYIHVIVQEGKNKKIIAAFTNSIDAHNYIRTNGPQFVIHKVVLNPIK